MLRLLLDEHLSDDIAVGVRAEVTGVEIVSLREWQEGVYVGAPDDVLLRAAYAQGTTLVTFDQRTIMPVLRDWGERGIAHGGVVFGSRYTFATSDFGGIGHALTRLWTEQGQLDWTNRVVYLRRS